MDHTRLELESYDSPELLLTNRKALIAPEQHARTAYSGTGAFRPGPATLAPPRDHDAFSRNNLVRGPGYRERLAGNRLPWSAGLLPSGQLSRTALVIACANQLSSQTQLFVSGRVNARSVGGGALCQGARISVLPLSLSVRSRILCPGNRRDRGWLSTGRHSPFQKCL
jgi:hypothetical protein